MKKKVTKVEEPAATYSVGTPSSSAPAKPIDVRRMDKVTFQKASKKVFKVHHDLFRKLAQ